MQETGDLVEPDQQPDFGLQVLFIGVDQHALAAAQSPENRVLSQALWATCTLGNPSLEMGAPWDFPIPNHSKQAKEYGGKDRPMVIGPITALYAITSAGVLEIAIGTG